MIAKDLGGLLKEVCWCRLTSVASASAVLLQRHAEQISGLQKTLEDRSEGVLLVDLAKPDWTILYNNEAWLKITGMGREEVLGANMFQIFTPAGQTKV